MGKKLHHQHLHFHREAVDGAVLFGKIQVTQAGFHHLRRFVQPVKIPHLSVLIGLEGMAEKLRLHPARIHGHDPDALPLQLPVHSPAVAEDEGLGGTVGGDVGHGLKGGQAVQLQNVAARGHVGHAQPGHHQQRLAVQVDHPAFVFQGNFVEGAEFAEARGVHQQANVRCFRFQHCPEGIEAFRLQ